MRKNLIVISTLEVNRDKVSRMNSVFPLKPFSISSAARSKGLPRLMTLSKGLVESEPARPRIRRVNEKIENRVFAFWKFKGSRLKQMPIEQNSR